MAKIRSEIFGLKCDNPSCDWSDDTIDFTTTDQYINMPCPKCGQNVLTEEDHTNAMIWLESVKIVNDVLLDMEIGDENVGEEQLIEMKVDLHKNIKITMPDGSVIEPGKDDIESHTVDIN